MTNEEALHMLCINGDPIQWACARYPALLLEVLANGRREVEFDTVKNWTGVVSHPSLERYTFHSIAMTSDEVSVELFGVKLVYKYNS